MTPPVISPTGGWIGTILFVLVAIAGVGFFATRAGELVALLVKARRENRTDHIDDRIGNFSSSCLDRAACYAIQSPALHISLRSGALSSSSSACSI